MTEGKDTVLTIVVPCYNEEEVLPITSELFLSELRELASLGKISEKSSVLFVDDGSADGTWEIIRGLSERDPHFEGVRLSRNRGHQNALLCGLMEAKDRCDITISIDADGQDDISVMEEMVDRYHEGYEVVYGVRGDRKSDTAFKRNTAQLYYRLLSKMGAETVYNHADYRLASARVLKSLADYHEVNLFLRGMFPLVGFRSTSVFYDRKERMAGSSKYPLSRMLALAFDGITSMSTAPLRLIAKTGVFVLILSFIGIIWAIVMFAVKRTVPGWASLLCIVCFTCGLLMISLGVLGEYLGKIYLETKQRPRFIVAERTRAAGDAGDAEDVSGEPSGAGSGAEEMFLSTLCYIEKDGRYLMLHRTAKEHDINKDKWIGVGGHFEKDESPEDCIVREVREETGYTLTSFRQRGIVTFVSGAGVTEYMFLFTADGFTGDPVPCDEGELEWVEKEKVTGLPIWEGDRIFLGLLSEDAPPFSLKLVYDGGEKLSAAYLDGKKIR